MGASGDGPPPVDRVAEIRAEIQAARERIAGALDGLRYKADVPARLGDSLGDAAATFTAHVLDRVKPEDAGSASEPPVTTAVRTEAVVEEEPAEP